MKELIEKHTKLESASVDEIMAILDYKLEETSPHQVADYVALSLTTIESRLEEIKQAEASLKHLKKSLSDQSEIIKIGTSKWLESAGVDKLEGNIVSSISNMETKPKEDIVIMNEEAVINQGFFKMVVDKTAAKEAILSGIEVEGAKIDVTYTENKIRVNKRRNEATTKTNA